jgi:hypothetical protein
LSSERSLRRLAHLHPGDRHLFGQFARRLLAALDHIIDEASLQVAANLPTSRVVPRCVTSPPPQEKQIVRLVVRAEWL